MAEEAGVESQNPQLHGKKKQSGALQSVEINKPWSKGSVSSPKQKVAEKAKGV
jgi:hypothetical protein